MDQYESITKTTPIWEGKGRIRKSQSIEKLNAEQKSYLKSSGKPLLTSTQMGERQHNQRRSEDRKK